MLPPAPLPPPPPTAPPPTAPPPAITAPFGAQPFAPEPFPTEPANRQPSPSAAAKPGSVPEGVILADNLGVLRAMPDGCIDLVYVDPPFGTGQVRRLDTMRTGAGSRTRLGFGDRRYAFEVVSSYGYRDDMSLEEYLGFLRERLVEVHRVLRQTGLALSPSRLPHSPLRPSPPRRALWPRTLPQRGDLGLRLRGPGDATAGPCKHDNILWYSRSGKWTFNTDDIDRIPYMAPGLVGPRRRRAASSPPTPGG